MLKNYFLIAVRNLKRHKLFSFINVLCLSLGITFSLLIVAYIFKQRNVNAGLRNVSNQYLIKSNWKVQNMGLEITTLGPLAKALKEEYPGLVSNYYRYNPVTNVVSAGHNYFKEDISIGDTTLVSMYDFPLAHGDKRHAFRDNNSAVITERMAIKLFGRTDAIGDRISVQTLVNNKKQDYVVSAVLKDLPYNTITGLIGDTYDVFLPFAGNRYYQGGDPSLSWSSIYEVGFIELKEGVTPADMQKPLRLMLAKNAPEIIRSNLQVELAPVREYFLEDNNGAVNKMIATLALIGGFILLMAVINFVNISIGTSTYRLKEIGLRKVLGGNKRQLVLQFLSESGLLALLAGIISLLGYSLLRPVFNQLLNTSIAGLNEFGWFEFICLFAFILVVGMVAGFYPALVLSSSKIALSVKGKMSTVGSGALVRKSLLVTQFTLTIIVFIGALSVSRQVSYIFNKDLGYNKEQLLVVTAFPKQWDSTGVMRMDGIKRRLQELPVVNSATLAFEVPDRKPPNVLPLMPVGGNATQPLNLPTINVDEDYATTYGIKIKTGTFFNQDKGAFIPGQVVLNESAARSLGLDINSAVGQQLKFPASLGGSLTVAGIVGDYNYSNIQEGIEPLAFMHVKDALSYRYLTLRLNPGNIGQAMTAIKQKWKEATPASPFEYFFMDDKFQSLYMSELQLKKAANVATVLNLVIVLMGVFGVVAFTLTRRHKEIAVRKVLGANAPVIIGLFWKEYGLTILISNLLAWPVSYLVINNWLDNYQYRVQQDIFSYLVVGASVLCLALLVITIQCLKVAGSSPVTALRAE